MTTLPTLGLLSVVDGRLMGDIGQVYEVIGHFIGRPAFTHELPMFAEKVRPMIAAEFPELEAHKDEPWTDARDAALARYGEKVVAPPAWTGATRDQRSPLETLSAAIERARSQ